MSSTYNVILFLFNLLSVFLDMIPRRKSSPVQMLHEMIKPIENGKFNKDFWIVFQEETWVVYNITGVLITLCVT